MQITHITPAAEKLFIAYMNSHRKAKRAETKCSGVKDIINNMLEYFNIELGENAHEIVLKIIKKNGGVLNKRAMTLWVTENYYEIYYEKGEECS